MYNIGERKYNNKSNITSFKKGHKTNVGRKCSDITKKKIGIANKGNTVNIGRKQSEKTKQKNSESKKGEKNPMWKGDDIGKYQRHERIKTKLGEPKFCEICKRIDKKIYDWSSKNHKYSLEIKDWQRLCRSCHKKYDNQYNKKLV